LRRMSLENGRNGPHQLVELCDFWPQHVRNTRSVARGRWQRQLPRNAKACLHALSRKSLHSSCSDSAASNCCGSSNLML
jgi:hypothetical protein